MATVAQVFAFVAVGLGGKWKALGPSRTRRDDQT